ncbi:MAG: hypothetical protein ACREGJ_02815 [Candidatus Saccharimonadales bacterium]
MAGDHMQPGGLLLDGVTTALIKWGDDLRCGAMTQVEIDLPESTTLEQINEVANRVRARGFQFIHAGDHIVIRYP